MSNPPFGFGMPDPEKRGENEPSDQPSGAEAFSQLGQMFSQLGQMLSQAGSSSGPVNYELAKQIALQNLAGTGEGKIGFTTGSADSGTAVRDAAHLAELWLDAATILPQELRLWVNESSRPARILIVSARFGSPARARGHP